MVKDQNILLKCTCGAVFLEEVLLLFVLLGPASLHRDPE